MSLASATDMGWELMRQTLEPTSLRTKLTVLENWLVYQAYFMTYTQGMYK